MAHATLVPLADDPPPPPSPSHTHSSAHDLHSLSSRDSDWSSDAGDDRFDLVSSAELPSPTSAPPRHTDPVRSHSPASAASSADDTDAVRLSFPDPLETSTHVVDARSILLDGEGAYSLLLDAPSTSAADRSPLTSPLLRAREDAVAATDVEGVKEWVRRTRASVTGAKRDTGVQASLGDGVADERGAVIVAPTTPVADQRVVAGASGDEVVGPVEADQPVTAAEPAGAPKPDLAASALSASVASTMLGSSLVSSQATVVPSSRAPVAQAPLYDERAVPPVLALKAPLPSPAQSPLPSHGAWLSLRRVITLSVFAVVICCLADAPLPCRQKVVPVGTPSPTVERAATARAATTTPLPAAVTVTVNVSPRDTSFAGDLAATAPTAAPTAGHAMPPPAVAATSNKPASAPVNHTPCAACALATVPAAPLARPQERRRPAAKGCLRARACRPHRAHRAVKREAVSLFREGGGATPAPGTDAAKPRDRDVLMHHSVPGPDDLAGSDVVGAACLQAWRAYAARGARLARDARSGTSALLVAHPTLANIARAPAAWPATAARPLRRCLRRTLLRREHTPDESFAVALIRSVDLASFWAPRLAALDVALGRPRGPAPDAVFAAARRASHASAVVADAVSARAASALRGGARESERHVRRAARTVTGLRRRARERISGWREAVAPGVAHG
ncbi:hypothetical protein JCM3770_007207 [Rhodotorula araucariae]